MLKEASILKDTFPVLSCHYVTRQLNSVVYFSVFFQYTAVCSNHCSGSSLTVSFGSLCLHSYFLHLMLVMYNFCL